MVRLSYCLRGRFVLACGLLLGVVRPALADSSVTVEQGQGSFSARDREQARIHFRMGVDFYKDRDFRAALIEFRRAYAIVPHHTVLFNLAQAALELKEYVMALDYLEEYLKRGGSQISQVRRDDVLAMMQDLRSRTSMIEIKAPPEVDGGEVRLDGESVGSLPLRAPIRVGAGRRQFSLMYNGREVSQRIVEVAAGDSMRVYLEPTEALELEPKVVQITKESGVPAGVVWMGATTGAVAVGAVVMTFVTMSKVDEYNDLKDGSEVVTTEKFKDTRNQAKTFAWITDGLYVGAAVSAAVTAILYFSRDEREVVEEDPVSLEVGLDRVVLSGRF